MKTTIDIPSDVLEEAIQHTGARTKREAVNTALAEFNRQRRLAVLVEELGTFGGFLTHAELARLRDEADEG